MEEKKYNPKLLADLRFTFMNSLYNQKINQHASNRFRLHSNRLFFFSTSLLALYLFINFGGFEDLNDKSLFKSLFDNKNWLGLVGVLITIFRYWGQFDLKSIKYENTAKKYRSVRDDFISLISDYMSNSISNMELQQKRDLIKKEIGNIDQYALSTAPCDYKKAQKDLRGKNYEGEHFTFSNVEIDKCLPEELRVTQQVEKEKNT